MNRINTGKYSRCLQLFQTKSLYEAPCLSKKTLMISLTCLSSGDWYTSANPPCGPNLSSGKETYEKIPRRTLRARSGSANLAPSTTEAGTLANSTGNLTSNHSRPMHG